MPPSAMMGTSYLLAASAASAMAVSWGTPTPATMRVVQIEPGPTPTLMPSAKLASSSAASLRRDVADHHVGGHHLLDALRRLDDAHVVRVGAVDADRVHAGLVQRHGPLDVEGPDGRRDA